MGTYAYANNNPVMFGDPEGLFTKAVCIACFVTAGLLSISQIITVGEMLSAYQVCVDEAGRCMNDPILYKEKMKYCEDNYGLNGILREIGIFGVAADAFLGICAGSCVAPSP